ncbi:hypothetical protein [Sporisorium scitamineum]|uniref:Uncharacterized protein n=1 Tax=Sporisorium scitamineum TaxID=49012 RepID=A0A0F7SAI7_9BASI|nr:hypothetical protein [Sporisorium scitamineum]
MPEHSSPPQPYTKLPITPPNSLPFYHKPAATTHTSQDDPAPCFFGTICRMLPTPLDLLTFQPSIGGPGYMLGGLQRQKSPSPIQSKFS